MTIQRSYIGFRDEVPFAINGSERGERTIESLGLRRDELNERRFDYLTNVLLLAQSFQQYQKRDAGDGPMLKEEERTLMEELHQHLELLQKYDKPYASMIRYACDLAKLDTVAAYVVETTQQLYPDFEVPFHSRWRHFDAGGVSRLADLSSLDPRSRLDLAIISVLLDAGAGQQ